MSRILDLDFSPFRRCLILGLVWYSLSAGVSAAPGAAQASSPPPEASTTWQFGIELSSPGEARDVRAAFPLPQDWPEQTIELGPVEQSGSEAEVEFLDLETARMAIVHIPRLAAGEKTRIVFPVRVTKRTLPPPANPQDLVFSPAKGKELRPFLRPSPQIESNHRQIKELVKTHFTPNASQSAWDQVETIYRWVRDEIEYQFEETNRSCLEALAAKRGDCGEMTGLFIALCRAKGIPARAVWVPDHTYPEFYLEDAQGVGHWFPCQVAGDYAFGALSEAKPILQKGDQFKVPGQAKATRYAQPTVTADDASQPLQLLWLIDPLEKK